MNGPDVFARCLAGSPAAVQMRTFGRLWPVSDLTRGGGGLGQLWGATNREEAVKNLNDLGECLAAQSKGPLPAGTMVRIDEACSSGPV